MSMVTNARHIVIAAALALTLSIGIASSVAAAKGSHRSKIPSASNLILAPAKSLPTVGECAGSIVVDVDGNVQELFCPNGDIRVRAWKYFAQMGRTPILALGPRATTLQLERAVCTPQPGDEPIVESEFKLASAYYGWSTSFDPLVWIEGGHCLPSKSKG
jgi:hypothetical protein